jgi:Mor family transcriptional regulator
MRIQFKFREQTNPQQRRRVLDRLDPEVEQVERLFPEDTDPELATLYVAVLPHKRLTKALGLLRRSKAVEFAEPEAGRRLYLPEELKGRKAIAKG